MLHGELAQSVGLVGLGLKRSELLVCKSDYVVNVRHEKVLGGKGLPAATGIDCNGNSFI